MLVNKSPNVEERTSNEEGYQRCPELPHCGLRTASVNPGPQYAVRKLRNGHRGIMTSQNGHQPTDNHSKYHSGQYLFFIPFSTGGVTGER